MEEILKAYNLNIKHVDRYKTYYLLTTDTNIMALKKVDTHKKNIETAHIIKTFLLDNGFHQTDKFLLANHKPYLEYKGDIYIITNLTENTCVNFDNNTSFLELIQTVSKMYNNLKKTNLTLEEGPNLNISLKKSLDKISSIKKRVGRKTKLTDFDIIFLKNYETYLRDIEISCDLLAGSKYEFFRNKAINDNAVCHNALKKEHLIHKGGKIYITNFYEANNNYYMWDFATIIKSYAGHNPRPIAIEKIIEAYSRHIPMDKNEVKILYALLKYPYKFVKISEKYYAKQRSYVPSGMLQSMNKIIESREGFRGYIKGLNRG